jgi:hypothetical protein
LATFQEYAAAAIATYSHLQALSEAEIDNHQTVAFAPHWRGG